MFRPVVAFVAVMLAIVTSDWANAQNEAPDSENGRYFFTRVEEGYLRLDQRTGQVSLCSRRNLGWACHPVPDERSALEEEIARLQKDNAAMKREIMARGLVPPGTMQPETPAQPTPQAAPKAPSDAEIDRAMAVMEKIWRRLVDMITRLQRDIFT